MRCSFFTAIIAVTFAAKAAATEVNTMPNYVERAEQELSQYYNSDNEDNEDFAELNNEDYGF